MTILPQKADPMSGILSQILMAGLPPGSPAHIAMLLAPMLQQQGKFAAPGGQSPLAQGMMFGAGAPLMSGLADQKPALSGALGGAAPALSGK